MEPKNVVFSAPTAQRLLVESESRQLVRQPQGCGIKGFLPTSVIQENPPLYEENSLWEALSVVSQKGIPFPTALVRHVLGNIWFLLGAYCHAWIFEAHFSGHLCQCRLAIG